ncbi:MAG TPA: aminotransferase class I/II-fold pyridoxal phosphate-dependent enzyme [Acidimicrobiales bacterium]|nr:aminotransferase class I/II-fold pyridoxal phosphate-dependent enzyme [Acidimicrobiales bacterium]
MTPPPPVQSFASDNAAGAHPRVLEALRAANLGSALPYGEDPWTAQATERMRDIFGGGAEIFFAYGGTGANIFALQSVLAPYEAVVCPAGAHINVDECGAPERFIGAKLIDVPAPDGKLSADAVRAVLRQAHGEHNVQPKVLAISQSTELGSVYTVDEIAELTELAHEHSLLVYVDGARIANAAAALGCPLRQFTRDAGVDVLTFGGTKNGLLYGEAVVFLRPELAAGARFARKQAGQLASKMRFIAAQFDALLEGGLWLANAAHANAMAKQLGQKIGDLASVELTRAVEVNSLFVRLPSAVISDLQEWSFFWTWDVDDNLVRWMTSFATADDDVDRFVEGVRYFAERRARQP